MKKEEAKKRFNNLPKEDRITIIANDCLNEISCMERQKRDAIKAHKVNLKRINERIKSLEDWIKKLD